MYTAESYGREIDRILPRYKMENTWFKWWPKADVDAVLNGWRMYRKSSGNALGFLLLGDTAIRTDKTLLFNFGLTSAHGVQEQKDIAMIDAIMNKRRGFASTARPATELLGPGSILSDKEWSPLLNDAFVLGGVNDCQEFHLADDAFHGYVHVAQTRAIFGETAKGYKALDQANPAKDKWRAYFRATPTVFWAAWGPRVFAREVIGMKTFGYRPVFTKQELAFECVDRPKAMGATFTQYIDALAAVGFGAYDRKATMAAISEYLFGAKDALT
jgi:hypothetical protein